MNVGMKCEARSIWHLHRQDGDWLADLAARGQGRGCWARAWGASLESKLRHAATVGVSAVLVSGVIGHWKHYWGNYRGEDVQ